MTTLDRLPHGSRVAIIRLRSLGDCVLSTPAIHLLKQARPDLEIAVISEDRFAPVFEHNPDIGSVLQPTIRAIRGFVPQLCLNLHGGTRSARLTLLSGAAIRSGFNIFRPGWIYNVPIPTAQEVLGIQRRVHTAEHAASAMFYLGVPVSEVPRARLYAAPGRIIEGAYAVIHPVAATPEKTWPVASFLRLADYLRDTLHLEPVFIGGPGDDLSAFSRWRTIVGAPLGEVARLMRDATLFAGNDSGPAHIAAAFGRPQVVLFGPSDAETWAPWQTPARVLKAAGPIDSITIEQAVAAVNQVLEESAQ
jgi:ADP-heptose:LPS heptosyltransferase